MAVNKLEYGTAQISTLEGIEAIRLRPGMYIGSTGLDGVQHILLEIISNSIDEYLAGACTRVTVSVGTNNSLTVKDNGRGMPFGKNEDGEETLVNLLTKLHTGAKFASDGSTGYNSSGGLHGVGAKATNALSEYLIVQSVRDGKIATAGFKKGELDKFYVNENVDNRERGTTIEFLPDKEIFSSEGIELSKVSILKQLQELSFLSSGLEIVLEYKDDEPITLLSDDGLVDYIKSLAPKEDRITPIFRTGTEEGKYMVDIALTYNKGHSEIAKVYTNNIPNSGGTHLTGFRSAMTRTVNDTARELGFLKDKEDNLTGEDLREGLVLALSLKMSDPVFSGQTKDVLTSSEARTIVEKLVGPELRRWFRANPEALKIIVEKAQLSKKARLAAKRAREATRGKSNSVLRSSLQGKLADCLTKDPEKAEIYLVEGDSAGGSAKSARDRETQAVMALQGKVLNAQKNDLAKLLTNKEIKNMVQAFGCGIGEEFDYDKLRYDKIVIMADSDVDGSHIRVLLLTFFFNYMPELIEKGHVYLAMAPLYKVAMGKEVHYLADESELETFKENNPNRRYEIKYIKGLGELDPEDLGVTTLHPGTRRMKQVQIGDEEVVARVFETLMGSSVSPRRQFIEDNSWRANVDI